MNAFFCDQPKHFKYEFMFAAIFTGLGLVFWITDALLQGLYAKYEMMDFKHLRKEEEEDRDK